MRTKKRLNRIKKPYNGPPKIVHGQSKRLHPRSSGRYTVFIDDPCDLIHTGLISPGAARFDTEPTEGIGPSKGIWLPTRLREFGNSPYFRSIILDGLNNLPNTYIVIGTMTLRGLMGGWGNRTRSRSRQRTPTPG